MHYRLVLTWYDSLISLLALLYSTDSALQNLSDLRKWRMLHWHINVWKWRIWRQLSLNILVQLKIGMHCRQHLWWFLQVFSFTYTLAQVSAILHNHLNISEAIRVVMTCLVWGMASFGLSQYGNIHLFLWIDLIICFIGNVVDPFSNQTGFRMIVHSSNKARKSRGWYNSEDLVCFIFYHKLGNIIFKNLSWRTYIFVVLTKLSA